MRFGELASRLARFAFAKYKFQEAVLLYRRSAMNRSAVMLFSFCTAAAIHSAASVPDTPVGVAFNQLASNQLASGDLGKCNAAKTFSLASLNVAKVF
jgi:hypothetical protein